MPKKNDTEIIKQRRKQLLINLDLFYPTPVQLKTLFRTLCHIAPEYEFPYFIKDIFYFEDKGYLEFVDNNIGGIETFNKKGGIESFGNKVIKLFTKGKEMARRLQTDPALEI